MCFACKNNNCFQNNKKSIKKKHFGRLLGLKRQYAIPDVLYPEIREGQ